MDFVSPNITFFIHATEIEHMITNMFKKLNYLPTIQHLVGKA